MILNLHIQNYALIESLEVEFPKGLTIITGETGAGKSIILGALGLIMGERADTKALFHTDRKCVIEGRFQIGDYQLQAFFHEHDLDYEDELIIRREITPSGKTRAFVNDTPTSIKVLQQLSASLIDLHQQFDTLDIHQMGFQLRLLDALAGNGDRLVGYQKTYRQFVRDRQQLEQLQNQSASAQREAEFIQFQLQELEEAALVEEEQGQIETEFASLSNAEDTKRVTSEAYQMLCEADNSLLNQLQQLNQSLQGAAKVDGVVQKMQERLVNVTEEITDLGNELERHAEATEFDPARIQELQERLDLIYKLQKKHHVTSVNELLVIQSDLATQLRGFTHKDEEISRLTDAVTKAESQLLKQSATIRKHRQRVAPGFAKKVGETLADLAMPTAQLVVDMQEMSQPGPAGMDEVQFLFSANKGSAPKPIKNVASGGELSRLTLVTKSLVADAMALPTLIFDEIDAGVSGDVARKMGQILQQLSAHHQVIVITHSPQVAACADEHFFVYKKEADNRTTTKIRALQADERIRAIAVMLSQNPPSESALENAKELIGMK